MSAACAAVSRASTRSRSQPYAAHTRPPLTDPKGWECQLNADGGAMDRNYPVQVHARLDAQPRHLRGLQQRPVPERPGQGVDGAGEGESMSQAHPVQGSVGAAFGGVEVEMTVYVQQARQAGVQPLKPRDDGQGDGAIAAEDQDGVTIGERRAEPVRKLLQAGCHLAGVLREWPLPVRPPDLLRQIPVIADQQPGVAQRLDKPGITQSRRCLILPRGVTARAAGHADDRQSHHLPIMDRPRVSPVRAVPTAQDTAAEGRQSSASLVTVAQLRAVPATAAEVGPPARASMRRSSLGG